ncbi:MAG: 3-deoxy-D-manno-octulosonic acid transferase [Candidatus Sumerlaeaceae bacterium]
MGITLYDVAYLAATPAAASYIAYKAWRQGKYQESIPAMLGRSIDQEDPAMWRDGSVWVHAVSVGEVMAAKAMLPLLRKEFPQWPILLTTHTETGQAEAKRMQGGMADAVRYFPFDYSWTVRRFADVYKPRLFIPMETELWPNVLNLFAERGASIFVLNCKISERSFRSYSRIRPLLHGPLSRVAAFCVQTAEDGDRVRSLTKGMRPVHVTGNCKFDTPIADFSDAEAAQLRQAFGISEGQPVVVVGSTHPGEEQIILDAWKYVHSAVPGTVMLLAPRHPERFDAVWNLLCASGFRVRRASTGQTCGEPPASLVLVDQMGILAKLYALSNVAIIAGSFVQGIGGHNLQEAAGHGVPVIHGPYMRKQPDMVRILTAEAGGTMAEDSHMLAEQTIALLKDPELARDKGSRGRDAFQRNRGSSQRNIEIIRRYFK